MSALFHNDFDRLLRERMMSHGGVDVNRFKESKDFIRESEMEKMKAYREEHKEDMKTYQREWYLKNREKILAKRKAKASAKEA